MTHASDKAAFRLRGRSARQGVLAESRRPSALAAAERLLALPELAGRSALTVLAYSANAEELDPAPALAALALRTPALRVAYPRVSGPQRLTMHLIDDPATQLVDGIFGLKEPGEQTPIVEPEEVDVAVVPGVAFDKRCRRLGHGGGYYDQLLPTLGRALTVGFAFDGQVFGEIPVDPHDVVVDVLVTPSRTLRSRTTL